MPAAARAVDLCPDDVAAEDPGSERIRQASSKPGVAFRKPLAGCAGSHALILGIAAIAAASPAFTSCGPDSKPSHSTILTSGVSTRSLAPRQACSLFACMI